MVSLSLFTIVVLAAVASLYTVNSASRKVQAMRTALDNLNFAIESMSRTIRTGTNVGCNGSFNNNCPLITQTGSPSPGGDIILNSTIGYKGMVRYQLCIPPDPNCASYPGGTIQKQEQGGNWISLTSPEINVQKLVFYVDGATPGDGVQPGVTMFVQGVATAGGTTAPFSIQTFVVERTLE